MNVIDTCRADSHLKLADHDPRETFGWDKEVAKAQFVDEHAAVAELHKKLMAEEQRSLLIALQAMDAGGKGGIVRSVMTGLNPAGVKVQGFGVPTDQELAHDFLWRIHAATPAKGQIGVFDRSHYEDVLVVRVKNIVPEAIWRPRYAHIRNFESLLHDSGTQVVKIFVNISSEEQRERFQDRIDDPDERWKFRLGDLDDRARWDDYQDAFQEAIRETSTKHAPWYVVPGDRKWVRNLVVAKILRHHLEDIDPRYPDADEDIDGLVIESLDEL
ncbi:MAG: polyphosphate kinase [Ilumatobacter coccineus]|uniref:Polyphosphate kinase n=1 Tax=Ilumatobacter coccineus TaxID=467094 RepID=A0A2G6KGW3_9ACTN|nr:MAG: polyphosphate kinase [Ilumatobacter coccineus]